MSQFLILDPNSVLTFSGSGAIVGIDLSSFDEDADFISVGLPNFPLSSVNLASSFISLTSNDEGDFDAGPTDSVGFDESVSALSNEDCELRIPLSLFSTIDKTSVTGVKFLIDATSACTFRASDVRCVSADWVHAPLDIDTLYNRISRPSPPNGALYDEVGFPVNTSLAGMPADWPVLYRSDEPSSSVDPMPIDISLGSVFASGSLTSATGDQDYAVTLSEGDSISIPDAPALDFSGSFTLEAWIKPSDMNDGPFGVITKWNDASTKRGYRLSINTSGQIVFDWTTDGTTEQRAISTNANIVVGQWNHVALTFTKPASGTNTIIFYHNGEQVGTVTGITNQAVAATDRPLKFGAWITG